MEKFEMVATTLMGLEEVLANEIATLGGDQITKLKRAVKFRGDDKLLYKANLALRTALRVLVPIDSFSASNDDLLYRQIYEYPWEEVFSTHQSFAIDAVVSGEVFKHSKYVALKTKDAIADRFRKVNGTRPNVNTEDPDIRINVHIHNNTVTVSIDSSGTSLDRRGYRKVSHEAPINEVLAAGILLLSNWTSKLPLYDPMSGSGTFGIEAALLGTNTPPGLNRKFGFQKWSDFDENIFEQALYELNKKIIDADLQIYCRDLMGKNIETISKNATFAKMEEYLRIKKEDFFESNPKGHEGIVFLNPPYGERLELQNSERFYKKIGDTLKQNYGGYDAWIISSDLTAIKSLGLKTSLKIDLINGGLPAKLVKVSLY